jgi:glutathione synthase/RimK-type ligase-like ATP-grasp enzyme
VRFWFWRDPGGWGAHLVRAATERGHEAYLFDQASEPDHGIAFVRLRNVGSALAQTKALARTLNRKGCLSVVPCARMTELYDDKILQASVFRRWLPRTAVVHNRDDAERALADLGLPLISKASEGSSSNNIRLVTTRDQARNEIEQAFGPGIACRYGRRQTGYLYWQAFCPDNPYDYRVHIVGAERAIARRWNRDDVPFASGADRIDNLDSLDNEAWDVLRAAEEFVTEENINFAALDYVRDGRGDWRLLETSSAWSATKPSFQSRRFVSGRPCADLWQVMIEEWEAGRL